MSNKIACGFCSHHSCEAFATITAMMTENGFYEVCVTFEAESASKDNCIEITTYKGYTTNPNWKAILSAKDVSLLNQDELKEFHLVSSDEIYQDED